MIPLYFHFQGHPRRARVLVPERLIRPAPLLILFDGQNVFGDEGSYAGGWHSQEALAKLPGTVSPPIVVGLDHGHHHRNRELWRDLDPLLDLVIHQLLPAVQERWPVAQVVLGGASLGGLAALAGVFRHPQLFQGALCMSPSFWFDGGAIFREIPARIAAKIYVDVGRKEGRLMHPMAKKMVEALTERGMTEKQLMWRPDKQGRHSEKHWRRRLPKALRFFFRR